MKDCLWLKPAPVGDADFPTTPNALLPSAPQSSAGFLAEPNPSGTALLYSTIPPSLTARDRTPNRARLRRQCLRDGQHYGGKRNLVEVQPRRSRHFVQTRFSTLPGVALKLAILALSAQSRNVPFSAK